MKNIINKKTIVAGIISFLFLLFLLFQHQFLFMNHDDYGYASLSYAYIVDGVNGLDYSFKEIFEFINGHYQIWGGRVLYFLLEIILFRYTGLFGYRIVQSLAIFGIFFIIYKILEQNFGEKIENWKLALTTFILYGLIEIATFKEGIFWISASVTYVVPIVFLMLFIYIYCFKFNNKVFKSNFKKYLLIFTMCILLFLASFSQEQVGVASVSFILIYTIYNFVKTKKINWIDIIFLVVAIVGFLILALAPGNEVRQQHPTSIGFYQLPFIERIFSSIKGTITGNFCQQNKLFGIFFFTTSLIVCIQNIFKNNGYKIINIISLFSITIITIFMFIKPEGYFTYLYEIFQDNKMLSYFIILITLLQLGLLVYSFTIYLVNKKADILLIIFYCAIMSQAAMAIAPHFAIRSSIIFEFLYIIIGIKVIGDLYVNDHLKKIITYMLIPLLLICSLNMFIITKGYYENYQVNYNNDLKLKEVSKKIKNGEEIKKVELEKLPNDMYSEHQPYQDGFEYISFYIHQYYDLPEDLIIVYN